MAAPWPAVFEKAEREKIVKLHVEHGLTLDDLRVRLRCGRKRLVRVLAEAGVQPDNRPRAYQDGSPPENGYRMRPRRHHE